MVLNNDITLVFKNKEELNIPKEAINQINLSNEWMFKKRIKGSDNHTWTPIYDYVRLELNKDKLDEQTIKSIIKHKDLLSIKTTENNKIIEKYVAWGNNSRFSKFNNLQKNEENLFYIKITSCKEV